MLRIALGLVEIQSQKSSCLIFNSLHVAALSGKLKICMALITSGHASMMALTSQNNLALHYLVLQRKEDACFPCGITKLAAYVLQVRHDYSSIRMNLRFKRLLDVMMREVGVGSSLVVIPSH